MKPRKRRAREFTNQEARERLNLIRSYYDPRECWIAPGLLADGEQCAAESAGADGPCVPCIAYGRLGLRRPKAKTARKR